MAGKPAFDEVLACKLELKLISLAGYLERIDFDQFHLLIEMLGLKKTVVQMAKANGVRWYEHVLRRDDGHVLRKALEFEEKGKRKRGRPKKTRKTAWRRRMPRIERDGEWELERLLLEWGKSGHPRLG